MGANIITFVVGAACWRASAVALDSRRASTADRRLSVAGTHLPISRWISIHASALNTTRVPCKHALLHERNRGGHAASFNKCSLALNAVPREQRVAAPQPSSWPAHKVDQLTVSLVDLRGIGVLMLDLEDCGCEQTPCDLKRVSARSGGGRAHHAILI